MIDNYDSFTYNLVQYFGELGQSVEVHRNDKISIAEIEKRNPEFLVISPGPCTPNEAGISINAIQYFAGKVPMLGVCLGFQAMVQAYGGNIVGAKEIMHGKVSKIHHTGKGVFANLKNSLKATRYHSLVAQQTSLPDCFEVSAWTQNAQDEIDEIMGIEHKDLAIQGVQFHPESILTECGRTMLDNFLKQK